MHRPITSPLSRPLADAVTQGRGNAFSDVSLFAAGEQGGIYDISDLSTLFSDAAGTTPAVVDGVVGKVLDKSGRGNHRTQSTTASKPILRSSGGLYWLEYDGVDDFMVTAAVDFSATDKVTVWSAVRKSSDAAAGTVVELSATAASNNGAFLLRAPGTASNDYIWFGRGTTSQQILRSGFAAPITNVLAGILDLPGDSLKFRINANEQTATLDLGTGAFGNYALYFGRRGGTSSPLNGREYYTVIRGAASTATQISNVERIAARKCGVTL